MIIRELSKKEACLELQKAGMAHGENNLPYRGYAVTLSDDELKGRRLKTDYKVGDRVQWQGHTLNIFKHQWSTSFERGTVYAVRRNRICVLPDAWVAEGKTTGLRLHPKEVLKIQDAK